MVSQSFDDYVFQHFIEFHNSDCVYCSTKEKATGRTRLFLVANEQRKVFMRNARRDSWDELDDDRLFNQLKVKCDEAVSNNRTPYFTTLLDAMESLKVERLF